LRHFLILWTCVYFPASPFYPHQKFSRIKKNGFMHDHEFSRCSAHYVLHLCLWSNRLLNDCYHAVFFKHGTCKYQCCKYSSSEFHVRSLCPFLWSHSWTGLSKYNQNSSCFNQHGWCFHDNCWENFGSRWEY